MIAGLAQALRALGHEAETADAPLSEQQAVARCTAAGTEVLFEVNRLRPRDPQLPSNIRHIAWFQDIFTGTFDDARERVRTDDIVYTLGAAEDLGLAFELDCKVDALFTGVDEEIIAGGPGNVEDIDFSLCGFLRPPFRQLSRATEIALWLLNSLLDSMPFDPSGGSLPLPHAEASLLRDAIKRDYRPLRGELDIHSLAAALYDAAQTYIEYGNAPLPRFLLSRSKQRRRRTVERYVSSLVREYPRMLDRTALVETVLTISQSLELYGDGWNHYPPFRPYFRGNLATQAQLLGVYRRTRLNLANNTHGLGLHSRVLECMAVGGFIFMHRSPRDSKSGGMHTSFEPGTHYGMYTPETLRNEAQGWLRDTTRRREAGLRAAKTVKERHLWRHRAQQIIRDLSA